MCRKGQAQEHLDRLHRLFTEDSNSNPNSILNRSLTPTLRHEADTSGDGLLDQEELAALLHRYHKQVDRMARPLKRIQHDVEDRLANIHIS